jgi:FkbM family methyltransferase
MLSLSDLREFVAKRPLLRAVALAIGWPLVWWRRRILRRQRELYERAVAFPAYGEVAVPVQGVAGTFLVDIRSDILRRLVFSGSYEPEAMDMIRRVLPASGDAIDVGANIGIFSVLLARLAGSRRVLAIEPTPAVARRLVLNLASNGLAGTVIVEQCAVGSERGAVTINTIPGMEEYSRVGSLVLPNTDGKTSLSVTVPMHTLDELVAQHGLKPSFVKMDIEGSEMRALLGATSILERLRPTILAEVDDRMLTSTGSSAEEFLGFLRSRGYTVRRVDGGNIESDRGFCGDVLATHTDGPVAING